MFYMWKINQLKVLFYIEYLTAIIWDFLITKIHKLVQFLNDLMYTVWPMSVCLHTYWKIKIQSSASAFVSLRSDLVKSSDLRLPTTPHGESKTIFMSDPQNIQDMTFTTWLLGFQSVYKWVFKVWPMGRGDDSMVLNAVIPELPDLTQFLSSLSTSNLTNCNDHRRKWKIFF